MTYSLKEIGPDYLKIKYVFNFELQLLFSTQAFLSILLGRPYHVILSYYTNYFPVHFPFGYSAKGGEK